MANTNKSNDELLKEIQELQQKYDKIKSIYDQSKIDEKLKLSEERFKTIFNQVPLGIALIDSITGEIYEVNPMFAKIAGRSIDEMANIDWMSITHPDDILEDKNNMALLNAKKIKDFQMEKRYIHPNGKTVWINMNIAPIRVEDKVNPCHLCMIEDISDRKVTELALRKVQISIENSKVSIIIADSKGNIEYANPFFTQLSGYAKDEYLGKNPNFLKSDYHTKEYYKELWDTIKSGKTWEGEFYNIKKNGQYYWENAIISPIKNEKNEITHFVAVKIDITAAKK